MTYDAGHPKILLKDGGAMTLNEIAAVQGTVLTNNQGVSTKVDQSKIPQLTPVDWYADFLYAADSKYMYGKSATNTDTLIRYPIGSHTGTLCATPAAGLSITSVATTSIPGLIFIHVQNASGSGDIYRSEDYGVTVTLVLQLGTRNMLPPVSGARAANVRWLTNRNFCESQTTKGRVFFIGEYNVGSARTIGGDSDAVCLYKSTDRGRTWTIVCEWNTDGDVSQNDQANGGNYVRHIHAVKYCPVDRNTYVCFGDAGYLATVENDVQAGFIQWDGFTILPYNKVLSTYSGPGTKVLSGSQRYRLVDMIFEQDYMYVMTDAINAPSSIPFNSGVFKCAYDLSSYTRVDSSILEVPNRSGRIGIKTSSGNHIWLDAIEGANTTVGQYFSSVYTSSLDLTRYARNAVCRTKTGGVSFAPQSLFEAGGKIFIVNTGQGIGKDGTTAVIVDSVFNWNGERPDTIAPCYWIDKDLGTDDAATNRGSGPGVTAYKTLQYALTASRVPHGARVVLGSGIYPEISINPVFLTTLADTTEHVNISGAGMNATIVGNTQATSSWLFGPVSAAVVQNWDFQDLRLTTFKAGTGQSILLLSSYAYTSPFNIRFIRSRIGFMKGDTVEEAISHICINIAQTAVAIKPQFRFVDSELVYKRLADSSAGTVLFFHNNAAGLPTYTWSATRTVVWGGNIEHGGAGSTMRWIDCLFGGFTGAIGHIAIKASATVSPTGLRNRFVSTDVTKQIVNSSTLPIVGAGQFVETQANQVFNDATFFDIRSVYASGNKVRDSYNSDYTLINV